MYRLSDIALGLATIVLVAGYIIIGAWPGAVTVFLVTLMWLLGRRRRWRQSSSVGLFLFTVAAAAGLLLGLSPALAIIGTVSALAAWQLGYFSRHLNSAAQVNEEEALTARHQRRVLFAVGLGALLAGAANVVRVDFSFGIALLLSIMSLVGISRAVRFLRSDSRI